jgi:hypothetical protein
MLNLAQLDKNELNISNRLHNQTNQPTNTGKSSVFWSLEGLTFFHLTPHATTWLCLHEPNLYDHGPRLKSLLCESGTLMKYCLNNNTREIFLWQIFRIVKIVRRPNQIFYPFYNLLEHQLK